MKYYYVPKCPKCGSLHTGYYISRIKFPGKDRYKLEAEFMQAGELVRPVNGSTPHCNLYCEDCGLEWQGNTQEIIINASQLEELLELKGITRERIQDTAYTIKNSKREMKKEKKKKHRIRAFAKKQVQNSTLLDAMGVNLIAKYGSQAIGNIMAARDDKETEDTGGLE